MTSSLKLALLIGLTCAEVLVTDLAVVWLFCSRLPIAILQKPW